MQKGKLSTRDRLAATQVQGTSNRSSQALQSVAARHTKQAARRLAKPQHTCSHMSTVTHHPPRVVQHFEAAATGGGNAAHNGRLWSQLGAAVGIRPRVPLQEPTPSSVWESAAKDCWHRACLFRQAEVLEAWRSLRHRVCQKLSTGARPPVRQLARPDRGGQPSPPRTSTHK